MYKFSIFDFSEAIQDFETSSNITPTDAHKE